MVLFPTQLIPKVKYRGGVGVKIGHIATDLLVTRLSQIRKKQKATDARKNTYLSFSLYSFGL